MLLLRDRGFDVLETGTTASGGDTTVVYDLTGHPDWAARVARVFNPARAARILEAVSRGNLPK